MEHHATAGTLLGLSGTVWFYLLTVAAVVAVVYSLSHKIQLMAAGRREVVLEDWPARVRGFIVWAIGQKRLFAEPVVKHEQPSLLSGAL